MYTRLETHQLILVYPVGKIAEKAVCRSGFLGIWHCILSAINKNALLQTDNFAHWVYLKVDLDAQSLPTLTNFVEMVHVYLKIFHSYARAR